MNTLIRKICHKEGLKPRQIQPLGGGQVNQVFQLDEEYVLRLGAREDAYQRLKRETELMRSLPGEIPVPKVYAFGQMDEIVYQIQQFIPGRKLYLVWKDLPPLAQESIAAELAGFLKILHGQVAPHFGHIAEDLQPTVSWVDCLSQQITQTLNDIQAYQINIVPAYIDLVIHHFNEHKHVLQDALPVIVHGDLSFMNILVRDGRISALLDFEYAIQAPKDYELLVIEEFCLYPNDYAEEGDAIFCTADFANFFPLLRKHAPELFEIPYLRERVDLYHLVSALSSHVAWRKANLHLIPAEKMPAKEFYMARILNFIFPHGARLF